GGRRQTASWAWASRRVARQRRACAGWRRRATPPSGGARSATRRCSRSPSAWRAGSWPGTAAGSRWCRGPRERRPWWCVCRFRRGTRRGEGGDAVESSVRTRRVLIVDDEPGVRESLRMVLKEGYEPFAVGSSGEALETLAATSVDVVPRDI